MTNLSACEKMALEEVFECLQNEQCSKRFFADKRRILTYKMMRFYVMGRKFLSLKK